MKKGYLLALVEISDPEAYKGYTARTPGVIEKFGGRFISRGPAWETLEGDLGGARIVIVEFESPEMVDTFIRSPEYQEIKHFRIDAAHRTQLFILQGV